MVAGEGKKKERVIWSIKQYRPMVAGEGEKERVIWSIKQYCSMVAGEGEEKERDECNKYGSI